MPKTTKPKVIKEKVNIQVLPKLVSYTMTAIIPTGQYQNIQPSIVVEAETLEQAQEYVMPHIEALYKQYYNINENKVEIKPSVKVTPVNTTVVVPKKNIEVVPPKVFTPEPTPDVEPKAVSMAMEAALNAVSKCYNIDDLKVLEGKIDASTKLTRDEKAELTLAIMSQGTGINFNHK